MEVSKNVVQSRRGVLRDFQMFHPDHYAYFCGNEHTPVRNQ
jgi:hypothetical protein